MISVTRLVRRLSFSVSHWHPRVAAILAWLLYGLLSRHFAREHRAVWSGRSAYEVSHERAGSVLLRRNIHRLEKGLVMQPRRSVFGAEYISETVSAFARCVEDSRQDQAELRWAHDVLVDFFQVSSTQDDRIQRAREQFEAAASRAPGPARSSRDVPYTYSSMPAANVSPEQLERLCTRRRSVRWFKDSPVERSKIRLAASIARLAPSACNRQPFDLVMLDRKADASAAASIAMGTAGFHHNIPALAVFVGTLAAFPFERDRHVIYIDAALAAMQFMLALETLGLASCPINWPDIEERERAMGRRLNLEAHERVVMLIAFGYPDPDGLIPFSSKRSDIVRWFRDDIAP